MFSLDPQYEQDFYPRPEYYYINFPKEGKISLRAFYRVTFANTATGSKPFLHYKNLGFETQAICAGGIGFHNQLGKAY